MLFQCFSNQCLQCLRWTRARVRARYIKYLVSSQTFPRRVWCFPCLASRGGFRTTLRCKSRAGQWGKRCAAPTDPEALQTTLCRKAWEEESNSHKWRTLFITKQKRIWSIFFTTFWHFSTITCNLMLIFNFSLENAVENALAKSIFGHFRKWYFLVIIAIYANYSPERSPLPC